MKRRVLTALATVLCSCGTMLGVPTTDVLQFPVDYFVPDEGSTYNSPYYRWFDEDWGWTHNTLGPSFTSAELYISSWDVDWESGEVDVISAYDVATSSWLTLGTLKGATDAWSYTTFVLDPVLYDDVAAGLQVHMDIDSTNDWARWAVTLAKSVLTVDGGTVPAPDPSPVVPEPATLSLIGIGVLSLIRVKRKLLS